MPRKSATCSTPPARPGVHCLCTTEFITPAAPAPGSFVVPPLKLAIPHYWPCIKRIARPALNTPHTLTSVQADLLMVMRTGMAYVLHDDVWNGINISSMRLTESGRIFFVHVVLELARLWRAQGRARSPVLLVPPCAHYDVQTVRTMPDSR